MTKNLKVKIPDIKNLNIPGQLVFAVISGNHAKGLSVKNEVNADIAGVYVSKKEDFYAGLQQNTIEVENNIKLYEFTFFIKGLQEGNVDFIEMLFSDQTKVVHSTAFFAQEIYLQRLTFITKRYGYALIRMISTLIRNTRSSKQSLDSVLKKAEVPSITDYVNFREFSRHTSLPSFTITQSYSEFSRRIATNLNNIRQLGVRKVFNMENLYDVYIDITGKRFGNGIFKNNSIEQFDIPTGRWIERPIALMYFDSENFKKDSMQNETNSWLTGTIGSNWVSDIKLKNLYYDSESLMNTVRYIDIAYGFFVKKEETINVEGNREYYLSILNGEQPFEDVFKIIHEKNRIIRNSIKDSNKMTSINHSLLKQMANRVRRDVDKALEKVN